MIIFKKTGKKGDHLHTTDITFEIDDREMTIEELAQDFAKFLAACGYDYNKVQETLNLEQE